MSVPFRTIERVKPGVFVVLIWYADLMMVPWNRIKWFNLAREIAVDRGLLCRLDNPLCVIKGAGICI